MLLEIFGERGAGTGLMRIGLLVVIPFGILADAKGRRFVIALNLFGQVLGGWWIIAVCSFILSKNGRDRVANCSKATFHSSRSKQFGQLELSALSAVGILSYQL